MKIIPPLQQVPQLLTFEEITNPRAFIAAFFTWYHLPDCKRWVRKWTGAVAIKKGWKKYSPSDFLYFHEHVVKLIEVCFLINQLDNGRSEAILAEEASMDRKKYSRPDYYCKEIQLKNHWDYFPRMLNWKDYMNPYRVIARFFRIHSLADWKEQLNLILFSALSKQDLKEL